MEGPAAGGQTAQFPRFLTARWGQGSEGGDGEAALHCRGRGAPRSDPVCPACSRQCCGIGGSLRRGSRAGPWVSRQPASTPREAQTLACPRALLAHPQPPRLRDSPRGRTGHSTPGPVRPQTDSLDLLLGVTSGQTGSGGAAAPRTPAGPAGWTGPTGARRSLPGISAKAHAPQGRWRARASRPRAPGSIFSPH